MSMSDPVFTRRVCLRAGVAAGALWSSWLRHVGATPPVAATAKSVIMIFNSGAPSHIDLWDMKPDASEEVRGIFQPVSTNVPGIQISELMPSLATKADRLAIVRTVHHEHSQHNSAIYWSMVGHPYKIDSTEINPSPTDLPSIGTLIGWLAQREDYAGAIPPYVITPKPQYDSLKYITPGQYGGCLGSQCDPFVLNGDPNEKGFRVPSLTPVDGLTSERMSARRSLLQRPNDKGDSTRVGKEFSVNRDRAWALLGSGGAAKAFDLSRESTQIRERYGRHTWGQSHLLARRLIESGVRFVTTVNGPSIIWDTHEDNFNQLKKPLVPPMQQAYAALLDDLEERGLLESTLVLWMGDFGRTPKVNKNAGRDHWSPCYSVVLAGGGIRGGQVIGQSDKQGAYPIERPVTPADVHATVFSALGYDTHGITYPAADGRPMPLSNGEVIRELL